MSRVTFCRTVRFRASHYYAVPGLGPEENQVRFGPSAEPHVHDWALTVWLAGPVAADTGMMIDLGLVDRVLEEEAVFPFHGKIINLVDPFFKTHQPTNEVLAQYFADRLAPRFDPVQIARLRIAESPDLFAEWEP